MERDGPGPRPYKEKADLSWRSFEEWRNWAVRQLRLFGVLLGAPVDEVAGVEGDANEIGRDETELGGAEANDTDHGAVDGGDDPALPELLANENGGEHGQNAGHIVESNHVERI
jgi:hypothetical protein